LTEKRDSQAIKNVAVDQMVSLEGTQNAGKEERKEKWMEIYIHPTETK
jgi:hypothetical protein